MRSRVEVRTGYTSFVAPDASVTFPISLVRISASYSQTVSTCPVSRSQVVCALTRQTLVAEFLTPSEAEWLVWTKCEWGSALISIKKLNTVWSAGDKHSPPPPPMATRRLLTGARSSAREAAVALHFQPWVADSMKAPAWYLCSINLRDNSEYTSQWNRMDTRISLTYSWLIHV